MTTSDLYRLHAELCKVFTSPKRLEILNALRDSSKSVGELVKLTGLSQANISQHLAIMRHKGILASDRIRNNIFYSVANPKVIEAFDIMRDILGEKLRKELKVIKGTRG